MTDTVPLPEPFMDLSRDWTPHVYAAWADQMRAYGDARAAAEREACAVVCEDMAFHCESAAKTAGTNGENAEVSPLLATAWQLTVAASLIRKRK